MKKLKYEEIHKEIDGSTYKICSICGEWFSCTEKYFYKNKSSVDGFHPYCKRCSVNKSKKRMYEHYDEHLISLKKNNAREEVKEIKRMVGRLQRECGYQSQWRRENKDKVKQYNETRSNKNHKISNQEWESCKEYFNHSCAYCGISELEAKEQQGQYLHKEHVDHEGVNDLSNCIPTCKSCNSKKWAFKFEDWYNKDNPVFDMERYNKIKLWLDSYINVK